MISRYMHNEIITCHFSVETYPSLTICWLFLLFTWHYMFWVYMLSTPATCLRSFHIIKRFFKSVIWTYITSSSISYQLVEVSYWSSFSLKYNMTVFAFCTVYTITAHKTWAHEVWPHIHSLMSYTIFLTVIKLYFGDRRMQLDEHLMVTIHSWYISCIN